MSANGVPHGLRRRRRLVAGVGVTVTALAVAGAVTVLALPPPAGRGTRSATTAPPASAGTSGKGDSAASTRRAAHDAAVRPATLREVRIGGQARCLVVSDPVMSEAQRSPSRPVPAGAEAASAVWLPAAPGPSGCRSTVTSGGAVGAAAVVGLLHRAGPLSQVTNCRSGATGGGMVDLVLRYPHRRPPAVVRAVLGLCGFVESPDGRRRALPSSTPAVLASFHPPAWAEGPGSPDSAPGRPARLPESIATGR